MGNPTGDQNDRTKKLLDRAHEIRKFEIELYWRRTAYFWTLIAATFIGFFAIQSSEGLKPPSKQVLSFAVANLGFVFSLGWFLINRGSKFWQQNWEIHVDRLEQCRREKLYASVAYRPQQKNWLVDPASYSPSKINQITSFYVTVVWFGLGIWSFMEWYGECHKKEPTSSTCPESLGIIILFVLLTGATWYAFKKYTKTKLEDKGSNYDYHMKTRNVTKI